jgi:hypothetical protein
MMGFSADTMCIDISLHRHSVYYNASPVEVFPSTVSNISSFPFFFILCLNLFLGGGGYVDAVCDLRAHLHGVGQVSKDKCSERTELLRRKISKKEVVKVWTGFT